MSDLKRRASDGCGLRDVAGVAGYRFSGSEVIWRPYLPEPRPAFKLDAAEPEPVPLDALRDARRLCANFRLPPRQFRRRARRGQVGWYRVESDIVAVNPDRAAMDGLGGEDGYYATLVHELLHATGHPSRLGRPTTGMYSGDEAASEEGTVYAAQRMVLAELGFPEEALDWYSPVGIGGFPVEHSAARRAAAWMLA